MRTTLLLLLTLVLTGCDCGDGDGPSRSDAGLDGGDDEGDAGRIPGREVRVPDVVEADLGAVVTVPVTIVAGAAPLASTLTADAPRFVYINGEPATVRPLLIDRPNLEAGQQKEYRLSLQTLLTSEHSITLHVLGEAYDVPVQPRIVPPLVGVAGFGCEGPHEVVYGPDCGPCGLETTVQSCAATQPLDLCHPVGLRIPEGADEEVARAACDTGAALPIQFTDEVPASFWSLALDPQALDTSELLWVSSVLEEQLRTRPLLVPGLLAWWMQTCPDCANADGTRGAYDPANAVVFDGLQAMAGALARVPGVPAVQIASPSQILEHLCPCLTAGTACTAVSGPSQPACADPEGLQSGAVGTAYGPLMTSIAARFGAGVRAASPGVRVISAPVDDASHGLSPLTRVALEAGMADSVDALGVVSAPCPPPTWIDPMPDCAVGAPGCETAPPFDDWTALLPPEGGGDPVPTVVRATDAWRAFDVAVDPEPAQIALMFGGWDALPLWFAAIRGGFHGASPREAIAGLRIGTLLAAERVEGMSFVFSPTDPQAYELLVRTVSGTRPVRREETPEGYDDVVVRFLEREGEDVLVAWNNAEAARVIFVSGDDMEYGQVSVTRVSGGGADLVITSETLESPDTQISVLPLSEIVILKVSADEQLGFRWLQTLQF